MIQKKIGANILSKKVVEHKDIANGKGGGFSRVLDLSKVKGEHGFFSPKAGDSYRINIIPYEIKTKNHPSVFSGSANIGDIDYSFRVMTHRRVGPAQLTITCPKQFGKACPICEQYDLTKDASLKAKERYYYNVEDIEDRGKVKIFETYGGKSSFETQLTDRASANDKWGGGVVDFLSADGKGVQFAAKEDSFQGTKFTSFSVDSFFERDGELPDSVYQNGISFDECLNIMSYEDILSLMNPSDSTEESETTKSDSTEFKNEISNLAREAVETKAPSFNDMEECSGDCKKCPFGHTFRVDANKFGDCDDCEFWNDCCSDE